MGAVTGGASRPAASTPALKVWSLVDELVLEVHALTARFPADERNGLGRTLRDSALAAAGALMRGASGGDIRLCDGVGSALEQLAPLRYQIYLARRLNLLDIRRYRAACLRHDKAVAALKELQERPVSGGSH